MTLMLTTSPIGSRPRRIACISCQLYFSTAVCPVCKPKSHAIGEVASLRSQ